MQRVVSLFLPTWTTDRLRRAGNGAYPPPDKPFVTVGREGSRRVVAAADESARALGLRPGMVVAQASALVPGLALAEVEPEGDLAGLRRLAEWALSRYSPIVALDPPAGLFIDVTGCTHLFGDEASLLADLLARLKRRGITARAALADTAGAAYALARFGAEERAIVAPSGEAETLAPLPVASLRLDVVAVEGLRRLGFECVGQLACIPRAALALRFGPEVGRALDRALGRAGEPLDPVVPSNLPRCRLAFAEPLSAPESLKRAIEQLTESLCAELGGRGLGARRLDLLFRRVDGDFAATRVGTARPSRDPAHLDRLLVERLETVDLGFGIEAIMLSASLAEPLGARQLPFDLDWEKHPELDLSALVDRLAARLGPDRLYRVELAESDVPERSVRRVPPLAPASPGAAWPPDWPRPARLLTRPEPVQATALLPDYPPARFTWRGATHRVIRADGPERIFGEWWWRDAERDAVRDYFSVEDDAGSRFWLFRSGDGQDRATGAMRWFLHGLFG